MNKYYKAFLFSALMFLGMSVTSCDDEPVDSGITGEVVGKALLNLNIEGEEQVFRENLVGLVDKEGRFTLEVNGIGDNPRNKFILFTKLFEEGMFPTNINVSTFYDADLETNFSSVDPLRPNLRSGMTTLSFINKKAQVVSGDFEMRLLPEGEEASVNAEPIRIKGDFSNIPYRRAEEFYFDAEILQNNKERFNFRTDEVIGRNSTHFVELFEGEKPEEEHSIEIEALKSSGVEGKFKFTIPANVEVGKRYAVDNKHFKVSYTSRASVNYEVIPENNLAAKASQIKVLAISYYENEEGQEHKMVKDITLSFDLTLTEVTEEAVHFEKTVRVEFGSLRTAVKNFASIK